MLLQKGESGLSCFHSLLNFILSNYSVQQKTVRAHMVNIHNVVPRIALTERDAKATPIIKSITNHTPLNYWEMQQLKDSEFEASISYN